MNKRAVAVRFGVDDCDCESSGAGANINIPK
jgi:hypothetical protein